MCPALSIKFKFEARNSKFETSTLRCLDDLIFGICLRHRLFRILRLRSGQVFDIRFSGFLTFASFAFPGSVIPADAGIQGWRSGACFARKIFFVSFVRFVVSYFSHLVAD